MDIKLRGFVQAMSGDTLLINTDTDELVSVMIKDEAVRNALYCKKVMVIIETVPKVTTNKIE